ncbi:hypothetical protein ACLOJK_011701 [Asimina triloba]
MSVSIAPARLPLPTKTFDDELIQTKSTGSRAADENMHACKRKQQMSAFLTDNPTFSILPRFYRFRSFTSFSTAFLFTIRWLSTAAQEDRLVCKRHNV